MDPLPVADGDRELEPERHVRRRRPPPPFGDSSWVHAAIGAPVGAALAVVLEAPPRGSVEHLIAGALAGAVFAMLIGVVRPGADEPEFIDQDESQEDSDNP